MLLKDVRHPSRVEYEVRRCLDTTGYLHRRLICCVFAEVCIHNALFVASQRQPHQATTSVPWQSMLQINLRHACRTANLAELTATRRTLEAIPDEGRTDCTEAIIDALLAASDHASAAPSLLRAQAWNLDPRWGLGFHDLITRFDMSIWRLVHQANPDLSPLGLMALGLEGGVAVVADRVAELGLGAAQREVWHARPQKSALFKAVPA